MWCLTQQLSALAFRTGRKAWNCCNGCSLRPMAIVPFVATSGKIMVKSDWEIGVVSKQRVPSGKLTQLLKIDENGHLQWIFPLKMAIFHCYVSSPEGTNNNDIFYDLSRNMKINQWIWGIPYIKNVNITWKPKLVGGLEHFLFSIYWEIIIPAD